MATLFGSDPDLAAQSSSTLATIRDQIEPVSQWLGDPEALGVPEITTAVSGFKDAASSVTEDLASHVGAASDLLGSLASGTRELDQSLADRLGLQSGQPVGESGGDESGSGGGGGGQAGSSGWRKLPTTPVNEEFKGENDPEKTRWSDGRVVDYLNDSQRAERQLSITNGKLYDAKGRLFDTTESETIFSEGRAIWVMDEDGNLYASTEQEAGKFHHSSFLGGEPVAGAGEIEVENGEIKVISDHSGHYTPERPFTRRVVARLRAMGVSIPPGGRSRFAPGNGEGIEWWAPDDGLGNE
jgi:hypothetical protein